MEPDRVRVRLIGRERRQLRRAVHEVGADLCFGSGRDTPEGFTIDGILLKGQLDEARATLSDAGVTLTVIGPLNTMPHAVRTGDRYSGRTTVPRGLGAKE